MTHMVIVHTTDEKSFFPCEDLDAAVATIERFRNEDDVESCELFELNPISFEFKPYYHVALSTGLAGSTAMAAGGSSLSMETKTPISTFGSTEALRDEAVDPEVNVPVLSAVESPSTFEAAGQESALPAPAADPFVAAQPVFGAAPAPELADEPFVFAEESPSSLDSTLADVGVPTSAPIPALPESIPPAPVFGEVTPDAASPLAAPPAVDPFAQSPADAAAVATGATSGFGFELGDSSSTSSFDPAAPEAPESSPVSDLFGSGAGAELPPPPPPPPLEAEVEVDEQPRRGLFGR